ncbi:hypothetical protein [Sulfurirhabdus autotrophica]|nr:hypothetical protein [Sulfurirhabdus autotrophica]
MEQSYLAVRTAMCEKPGAPDWLRDVLISMEKRDPIDALKMLKH